MTQALTGVVAVASILILSSVVTAEGTRKAFETMSQPIDTFDACKVPKPPRDLAESAYIRNGYRAILRIMAAEHWRNTGSCDCVLAEISWDDVVKNSRLFVTSDNPRLPFDVVALDQQAQEMEANRHAFCATK